MNFILRVKVIELQKKIRINPDFLMRFYAEVYSFRAEPRCEKNNYFKCDRL